MERETLKSRLGFILLSAGCAIGIGNVWKFPYIAGQGGGGAFVLFYLIFLVILGLPIMTMEFAVGRASRKSPVRAYQALEKPGQKWHIHGYLTLVGCYLLMMFYTTVAGWMLHYFYMTATGKLAGLQKLADEMGMICYIGIRQGDMLAMVGQILPPTVPVWTQLTVLGGGVSQLYSTGIGRLFLSQDSDDEICRYLDRIQPKKYTDATITDRAELLELIHQAGKQKYSGNFGENESRIYSLCAPVYQMDGTMVAGVSLCGMQEDISGSRHDYYLSRIRETAQAISKELGYFGS
jgi:DNA-binding IclR family transcriptional regulator